MTIERVEGEVRVAAREPGEARTLAKLERAFRSARPIEALGGLEPEHVGVAQRALVQLVIAPAGRVGRDVRHRKSSIDPTRWAVQQMAWAPCPTLLAAPGAISSPMTSVEPPELPRQAEPIEDGLILLAGVRPPIRIEAVPPPGLRVRGD